ncbi:hypothetical protein ONZ45_g11817 [Pleurotus djamor]|nr:hypothetical protein ONZ45_g11817 [Pleurotus djamor]
MIETTDHLLSTSPFTQTSQALPTFFHAPITTMVWVSNKSPYPIQAWITASGAHGYTSWYTVEANLKEETSAINEWPREMLEKITIKQNGKLVRFGIYPNQWVKVTDKSEIIIYESKTSSTVVGNTIYFPEE